MSWVKRGSNEGRQGEGDLASRPWWSGKAHLQVILAKADTPVHRRGARGHIRSPSQTGHLQMADRSTDTRGADRPLINEK